MSVSEAISNPVVLPSLSESSEEVVGGLGETSAVVTSPNIPATLKENWPAVGVGKSSLCADTEDTGSRFNEESLTLLEVEEDELIVSEAKQHFVDAKIISIKDGVTEKIEVSGCSVVKVDVREYCISRNEMVDYVLELTLNGIYHRAPNNTFVRIHAPPSPCCFTGLPPSAPMMMLMSPPVPFISEEEGTMDSSSSTSGIPLRYQVILEGPPNPSAEFEVLKFTTSCVVRLDAERYHDLSPEDYHRLTFDEPRIIFDILAEELFPHVEGDSSLLHLKHL